MAKQRINNFQSNNTVLTQTNAGTAGGTINYISEGGIKRAWGVSSQYTVAGNGGQSGTVTLPTSFFSSITGAFISIGDLVTDARQFAYFASFPTATTVTLNVQGVTGSAGNINGKWYWEVIGT